MYKVILFAGLLLLAFGCQTQKVEPKKVVIKKWTALIRSDYDSSHLGKFTVYGADAEAARKAARRIAQKYTDETTHPAEVMWVKDEGPANE